MASLTKLAISNTRRLQLNSYNGSKMSNFRKIQTLVIKFGRWNSKPPQSHYLSSSPLLLFSTHHYPQHHHHHQHQILQPRHITSSSSSPNPIASRSPSMASNDGGAIDPSSNEEVLHSFLFFDVYKDGRVNVFSPPIQIVPAADDPVTGVKIKDVHISPDVSVRMFLPPSATAEGGAASKLPVLLYIHGGGFCMHSAFTAEYTAVLNRLVAAGNFIAVSVEYRLFPAATVDACYDDPWAALRWIAAHADGAGTDPWLNLHADFSRIYVGGDSAGGNISHTLAVRAGSVGLPGGVTLAGTILIHPYFGEDDKMWMYMCGPSCEGPRDRRMCAHPEDLARIGCNRVLVFVGEKDGLKEAGKGYVEKLKKSGWKGSVEFVENKDRDHCFHVSNPQDEEAVAIQDRIIAFINHNHKD